MTEEQRDRLLKLAKMHDMQKPQSFNMLQFWSQDEHGCRTPACSLGWASVLWPEIEEFSDGVALLFHEVAYPFAKEFFGLCASEAHTLFMPTPVESSQRRSRTPARQAELIREIVAKHFA